MTPDKETKLFVWFTVAALVAIVGICAWEALNGRGFVV